MEEHEAPAGGSSDFFEEFYNKLSFLKDKDEETCYKEMFRILDDTQKGVISLDGMRALMVSVQQKVQITDQELELLLDDIDKNKDGKIDFSEFYAFMLKD